LLPATGCGCSMTTNPMTGYGSPNTPDSH
jgi:hypothetical protein